MLASGFLKFYFERIILLIRHFTYFFFFSLFFIACMPLNDLPASNLPTVAKTPILTSTLTSTNTPSAIPTLTPMPSRKSIPCEIKGTSFDHEWCPENVLIDFYISIGDGGSIVPVPSAPDLILYPNGKMFILRTEEIDDTYTTRMLYKQFDRNGICKILNTFEEIGYLDYDPLDYRFVGGDQYGYVIGAGSVYLNINAWKSSVAHYYGLELFLSEWEKSYPEVTATPLAERVGWPIIDEKLMNAFYFMNLFPVNDFTVYQPEKLGIWLVPLDEKYLEFNTPYFDLTEWDVDDVSLNQISENNISNDGFEDRYAILTGKQADEAFGKLDHSLNVFLFFEEDANGKKSYYFVASRPILPYETLGNRYHYEIPDPAAPKPSYPLGCNDNDGVLPLPQP